MQRHSIKKRKKLDNGKVSKLSYLKKISFTLGIALFLTACNSEPKVSIIVPMASSGELNVRNAQYKRAISQHSLVSSSFESPQTTTNSTVKQVYVAVDKKDLPSLANEKRIALVIGNANYANAGSLANPINDSKAMASTLKTLGFKVLEYADLDKAGMQRAVDEFGNLLNDFDVSLFFYAGHGIQVNGNNYLIPVDARISSKNDVEYNSIDAGRVLSKMEDTQSKANIIILDACRNNPFERSWTRAVKVNGGGSGLAFMSAPSGSIIAYSTSPGNTAADGESGTNGVYTAALLEHMKTPNIPIEEMFKRVRVTVEQKTNKRQVSWESTSLKGNFFFKVEK